MSHLEDVQNEPNRHVVPKRCGQLVRDVRVVVDDGTVCRQLTGGRIGQALIEHGLKEGVVIV